MLLIEVQDCYGKRTWEDEINKKGDREGSREEENRNAKHIADENKENHQMGNIIDIHHTLGINIIRNVGGTLLTIMTTLTNAIYLKSLPFAAELFSFLSFSLSFSCFSSSSFPPFLEDNEKTSAISNFSGLRYILF